MLSDTLAPSTINDMNARTVLFIIGNFLNVLHNFHYLYDGVKTNLRDNSVPLINNNFSESLGIHICNKDSLRHLIIGDRSWYNEELPRITDTGIIFLYTLSLFIPSHSQERFSNIIRWDSPSSSIRNSPTLPLNCSPTLSLAIFQHFYAVILQYPGWFFFHY